LHATYEKYCADFNSHVAALQQGGGEKKIGAVAMNADDYLAPTVREVLQLPRPAKPSE
jgi:hypothetical protein